MQQPVKIMPCLDVQAGRVVKGLRFVALRDAGDPAECAAAYCQQGADELALLDITATIEGRATIVETVRKVAAVTSVPLTVGGGIDSVKRALAVLEAGASRISVSSAAVHNPEFIPQLIKEVGPTRLTVAIDVDYNPGLPSGYEVYVDGGQCATGQDVLEWAKQVADWGVEVILPTSKAGDGTRAGYDLPLIRVLKAAISAEIVASGGAGEFAHFYDAAEAGATILLAASVFHFGIITIADLKHYLRSQRIVCMGT